MNNTVKTKLGASVVPHPIQRAEERYGIKITLRDLMVLCQQCQTGYSRLKLFSDGSERHIVEHKGKAMIAVYKPYDGKLVLQKEGIILTLLPREAMNDRQQYTKANKGRAPPRIKTISKKKHRHFSR